MRLVRPRLFGIGSFLIGTSMTIPNQLPSVTPVRERCDTIRTCDAGLRPPYTRSAPICSRRQGLHVDVSVSFGIWLKQQRKALDLTQAELARRVGCAAITVQKIELDERRPSKAIAERLAEALDLPPVERPAFVRSARGDLAADRLAVGASSPPSPGAPRHNLPAQLTSFIGRAGVVGHVLALLQQAEVRLLTLTGPGGTGKTRVSLQIAAKLRDAYADGVWLVDLAPIGDPSVVASAIANVLGVRESTGRPLRDSLQTFLATKQMLLVLDNFEQVLAAAPLVAGLLGAAPRLEILVTSRSVLGVYGEQTFVVPPLALPDPLHAYPAGRAVEQVAQTEAVALFLARARAANPAFTLPRRMRRT